MTNMTEENQREGGFLEMTRNTMGGEMGTRKTMIEMTWMLQQNDTF